MPGKMKYDRKTRTWFPEVGFPKEKAMSVELKEIAAAVTGTAAVCVVAPNVAPILIIVGAVIFLAGYFFKKI
jgi:hypothetical protein